MGGPGEALGSPWPPLALMAVWGVASPQGWRPVAVFFPLGYPFPYGPGSRVRTFAIGSSVINESCSVLVPNLLVEGIIVRVSLEDHPI
jgi:hypothetical protein